MFEHFTDGARRTMARANQEAQRLNHEYIGTEHILMGLTRGKNSIATDVLENLGVDPQRLRAVAGRLVRQGKEENVQQLLPQTPRAKQVIVYAIEESLRMQMQWVGDEHMLLGLMRENDGVAAQALRMFDLNLEVLRQEVDKVCATIPQFSIPAEGPQQTLPLDYERTGNEATQALARMLILCLEDPQNVISQALTSMDVDVVELSRRAKELLKTEDS